jgi:hypothetical protein
MTAAGVLSAEELVCLRRVAVTLIPGAGASPSADALPDLDSLLQRAAGALGSEMIVLQDAIALQPAEFGWVALSRFAHDEVTAFDLISTVVAGAVSHRSPITWLSDRSSERATL